MKKKKKVTKIPFNSWIRQQFRLHYSINPLLSSQKTKTNAMVLKQKQIITYFLSKLLEKYPMVSEEVCCFIMRKPNNKEFLSFLLQSEKLQPVKCMFINIGTP